MTTATLELSGLRVDLGGIPVLADINLTLAAGERLVIAGPSGSGKSTLLRAIAGLIPLRAGQIHFGGRNITHLPPGKRGIGMVFQQPALLPHLNVLDNLCFGLRARGRPAAQARASAKDMAELLDLTSQLSLRPNQLSGGQAQRVALGRALLREQGLILLDEPLSALDAPLRQRLRGEILRLQQLTGTSLIHVTHDQQEAMALAGRLGILDHGRMQQLDSPLTVYREPANRFVAGFLGDPGINLLPLRPANGRWLLDDQPTPLQFSGHDGPIEIGVRAQEVQPGTDLTATVLGTEHQGDRQYLLLDCAGTRLFAGWPAAQPPPADSWSFRLPWDTAPLFAAGDGRRLR